ncbi:transcriptional regulator with XRE-family HTH domain [Chitinivorax tropicus]|uniref:Transcriptional regulator with XRE-family HTH domain n=2 Tax=Chitinivorax tropicus TaxID=714531 RepID=A0A840MUH3_9PROT|nr:transcriptional regulator with XRE-family HTH domain [Chitinivorax tropicus]
MPALAAAGCHPKQTDLAIFGKLWLVFLILGSTGLGLTMKLFEKIVNPREIRRKLGLNQQEFWTKIGVTQSGGSRYESGRNMPKPVRELLRLVHVEQLDLTKVRKEDFDIIDYLRETHPDLYKSLKKAVKARENQQPVAAEENN